jgi:hypothetical protein
MTFRPFVLGAAVLVLLIQAGCQTQPRPTWTEQRVLEVANNTLRENVKSPEVFTASTPHYLVKRDVWMVNYTSKSTVIGENEFTVFVNDKTGKVTVSPGY